MSDIVEQRTGYGYTEKSALTLAADRRLRPCPSPVSLIMLRSYSLPKCLPTGCTMLLVRDLVNSLAATSRQSLKIQTYTLLGHLNFSVAANEAWSDGHSPPLGGGSVLSRFLLPRSLMSATCTGLGSEKIMSIRSYNSLRWFSSSSS